VDTSDSFDESDNSESVGDTAVVLVPYNQISPPSKWNADKTPLKNFDFNSNCTRLAFHFAPTSPIPPTSHLPLFPLLSISGVIGVIDALDHEGDMEDAVAEFNSILTTVNKSNGSHLPGSCVRRIFLFNSFHPSSTFPPFSQTPEVVVFPPDGRAGEGGGSMVEFHLTVGVNDIVGEALTQTVARVEGCLQRDSLLGSVMSSNRRRHSKVSTLTYPGDRGLSSEQTRRLKTAADLALGAGATYDAFDMYGKAAKALESDGDNVWAAGCYAGMASAAVAMADLGGGGSR